MPTYEYKCPKCGTVFERFQKITAPPEYPCPKCGAVAPRQLSGGAGVVFKGSGFYETDYKRAGEKARKKKEEGEKPSPPPLKSDTGKTDTKAD